MNPHPVDVHVGKRLRLRRNLLGLSQESLATSVGVTFQQVQKYESGKNRISSSRLYDFAGVLTVPIVYFFQEFGEGTQYGFAEDATPFGQEGAFDKDTMELIRIFNKVSDPALRKKILQVVRSVVKLADD